MIKQIIVMPAWIAGIQVRKDASGNIHVNLDSSTPCWNDAIEGVLHKLTESLHRYFQRRDEEHEVGKIGLLKILLYVLCALCG
jgi:hypothetical protein